MSFAALELLENCKEEALLSGVPRPVVNMLSEEPPVGRSVGLAVFPGTCLNGFLFLFMIGCVVSFLWFCVALVFFIYSNLNFTCLFGVLTF